LNPQTAFVDSHIHLDRLYKKAPAAIPAMRNTGCLPVSWAFGQGIESIEELERYLVHQARTIEEINRKCLPCFFLTGVHPRNIPSDLRPGDVPRLLFPHLDHPLCLGMGEIGLEKGGSQEREILLAHLEMAPEVMNRGQVFGVHTPRADKLPITGLILDILKDFSSFKDRILVDHCTPETIDPVLRSGFWAGITLSPVKSSVCDLQTIAARHPQYLDRMVLNTDSGDALYHDLSDLVRADQPLNREKRAKLTAINACRFYGIWCPPVQDSDQDI